MQTFVGTMSIIIVVAALLIQSIWMFGARKGRNSYLRDISHFRRPSSAWSRYYKWRIESLRNSILDGFVFEFILVIILIVMILMTLELYEIPIVVPIVLFVVVLSSISAIQTAFKIKGLKEREEKIASQVENATDKIAIARNIVIGLISAGPDADGRVWFALYRVGQQQDPIGWAVRDVLLDPELKKYQQTGIIPPSQETDLSGMDKSSDTEGPGIS